MKLYLACWPRDYPLIAKAAEEAVELGEGLTPRLLVSYAYHKDTDFDALAGIFPGKTLDLIVDSGAFSADTLGMDISLRDYAAWVNRWLHRFPTYASLDVIGNAQASYDNLERLRDLGLSPLPVFHSGEPWSYLDRYLQEEEYIALGGMVGLSWRRIMPWLVRCHRMARPETRYHAFGLTAWKPLLELPWYSADSTAWAAGARFGKMALFDPEGHRWRPLDTTARSRIDPLQARLMRSCGVDPAHPRGTGTGFHHFARMMGIVSWMRAERWLDARGTSVAAVPGM